MSGTPRLLLDQHLPRSAVTLLAEFEIAAVHVGDVGLASALDAEILAFGRDNDMIVVTLDADFHNLLHTRGAVRPSVIRLRVDGLRAESLTDLLRDVLAECHVDLLHGAAVTVTRDRRVRVRILPLGAASPPAATGDGVE